MTIQYLIFVIVNLDAGEDKKKNLLEVEFLFLKFVINRCIPFFVAFKASSKTKKFQFMKSFCFSCEFLMLSSSPIKDENFMHTHHAADPFSLSARA
jgi:hypothetical protein